MSFGNSKCNDKSARQIYIPRFLFCSNWLRNICYYKLYSPSFFEPILYLLSKKLMSPSPWCQFWQKCWTKLRPKWAACNVDVSNWNPDLPDAARWPCNPWLIYSILGWIHRGTWGGTNWPRHTIWSTRRAWTTAIHLSRYRWGVQACRWLGHHQRKCPEIIGWCSKYMHGKTRRTSWNVG